ncbi:hypothetical protein BYT27DRAFT_7247274 [Phlegmacium glaucopus]|nr:hypothetical protein BYT27DRAFT_7247274 [Phlegmacium glaucopus]
MYYAPNLNEKLNYFHTCPSAENFVLVSIVIPQERNHGRALAKSFQLYGNVRNNAHSRKVPEYRSSNRRFAHFDDLSQVYGYGASIHPHHHHLLPAWQTIL